MSNHISHASLPYPIKNARFTILVPFLDADGDPTDVNTPDTEISQDGGAFADAAEEISTISGSNGMGYITLTGAETNNSAVGVCTKVASGPKATLATLYPRNLPILASGTASAGASGSITLASSITYDITGCFVRTTGGTGGGGTGGASNQARRITAYNTSTQVATVTPNWETTPSSDTTYDVLCPEGVTIGMLKALNPTTAGNTLDVSSGGEAGLDWGNIGSKTTTNALTGTTIATTQKVDVETIKTNPVVNGGTVTFPTNATLASTTNITAGTITTVTTVTNQLTAAQIATGVWQDSTSGDFTASGSIGKSLYTGGVVPGGTNGLFIAGTNAATVVTTSFTTTFTGNLTGSVASVSGAVGSVTGNVGGNVTGSVGSVTGNVGGSVASVASGGITAASIATDAIDADAIAADAVSEIQSGLATSSALSSLSAIFTGITSLAQWLGLIAGKQTGNSTARTELRATGAGSGTFDETTDSLEAVRDNVGTAGAGLTAADDAVISAIAALSIPTTAQIATAVLTTQMTESYAADGTAPTLAQAMFLTQQSLHEFAVVGTTRTVKKLDGTTTAATFTLDSSSNPTSTTRAS